jgi:hypothetical protein
MSHLHLNIFPIHLPNAEISVGVLPFDSKDAMRELRKTHAGTHVFNRVSVEENGKKQDLIYAVRLDGAACTIAPETKEIRLLKNLGVARQLVNESFIASFAGRAGRKMVDVGPLKVLSSEKEHDFIAQAVNGGTVPPWLLVRLAHAIEARLFHFDAQEPFLGLVFDHHTYRRIARPCSEWLAEGFDLTGLYVSEKSPFNDTRIEPRARLLGRVVAVKGSTLELTDCREGRNTVDAKDVQVEADYDGLMRCLNVAFNGKANVIERRLFDLQSAAQVGPKKLGELTRVENRLTQKPLRLLPGVEAPVLLHLDSKRKAFPTVHQAPQALYVFDRTFNKAALTDAKRGIFQLGPYSQQGFTPSKPRICVVCERSRKGEVEQFLKKLLEGHNEPGRKCFFPNGFIKTYGLQGKEVRFFVADGPTAAAYRKAAQEALAAVTTDAERWHLAYVQVNEASHDLRGEANPYLVAKATFLAQQIPAQEFMTETMRQKGSGLDFILSNIALASYAKLGGTPWHLKVDNPIAHELVFGLGSTSISDSRLGARQRMVGITTLFTSEGRYLLGNMSNAVPFEEYSKAVIDMLKGAIERVCSDMNWQKGDEVRLIFHSFKPLKDTEADAVKAVAESLKDYQVDFAFLHVAQEHDTVLFDSDNRGAKSFSAGVARGRNVMKGEFAPMRGTYFALNMFNAILSLTGAKEVKKPTDGLPYPVLLHLHRCSTFTDIKYLTEQVYTFAGHSWQSFDMARMPVTIAYSQLIARLLSRLGALPHFSVDSIHGRLNRLRWFL